MANKRIDELTSAVPGNVDVVPTSYATTGPAYKSTVASVVAAGLNQPNSATAGAGANITIKAADGVTSGAGGSIFIKTGSLVTSGANGTTEIWSDKVTVKTTGGLYGIAFEPNIYSYSKIYTYSSGSPLALYGDGAGANPFTFSFVCGNGHGVVNNKLFFQQGAYGLQAGIKTTASAYDNASVLTIINGNDTTGGSFSFPHGSIDLSGVTDAAAINGSGYQRITGGTALNGILPVSGATVHLSGRMIKIVNITGSTITVHNESTSVATVGNRLKTPNGASINFGANHMLQCIYDTVDSRWRVWMTS